MIFWFARGYATRMIWAVLAVVLLAVWVVCGIAHGGLLGIERKNNAAGGVGLAMWAGPFSALLIDRVKDKRRYCPWCYMVIPTAAELCPYCDSPMRGWSATKTGPDVVIIETRPVEHQDESA